MEVESLSWLLYLQWGYALLQFIRGLAVVKLLCKLPMWTIFYRPNRKKVVLLNDVYEDLKGDEMEEVSGEDRELMLMMRPGEEKNGIEIVTREGYWVKAKLLRENLYIIAHQNQVAKLWSTDLTSQDFVINKVDIIPDYVSTATKLNRTQTVLSIAATSKTTSMKHTCIYSPDISIPANTNFIGFLSTFPLFAQAKGLVLPSLWFSIALLLVDIFRAPLYRAYDAVFDSLVISLQLNCIKQRAWLYRFLSVFSGRWSYGDKSKKCVYNGNGCGFLVHTIAVFKNKDDYELTFGYGDYQSWYPSPEDQHFVINKKRIYALPILPRMGSYCKVVCKIDSIVTGKASVPPYLFYNQSLF